MSKTISELNDGAPAVGTDLVEIDRPSPLASLKLSLAEVATLMNSLLPTASESAKGIVEIADAVEVAAATSSTKAISPQSLRNALIVVLKSLNVEQAAGIGTTPAADTALTVRNLSSGGVDHEMVIFQSNNALDDVAVRLRQDFSGVDWTYGYDDSTNQFVIGNAATLSIAPLLTLDDITGDFGIVGSASIDGNLEVGDNTGAVTLDLKPGATALGDIRYLDNGILAWTVGKTSANDYKIIRFFGGSFKESTFIITDGDATVGSSTVTFDVKTVLQKAANFNPSHDVERVGGAKLRTLAETTEGSFGTVGTQDFNLRSNSTNAIAIDGTTQDVDVLQDGTIIGITGIGAAVDHTISAGAFTITNSNVLLDTEASAATDDLDTINGGVEGQIIHISQKDNSRDITVKHNTGNIRLDADGDAVFNNVDSTIALKKHFSTRWHEVSRAL